MRRYIEKSFFLPFTRFNKKMRLRLKFLLQRAKRGPGTHVHVIMPRSRAYGLPIIARRGCFEGASQIEIY